MRRDYAYPLRVSADRFPDRVAFDCAGDHLTYREVDDAVDRLASAFDARGLAGQHVVLLLNNEPMTVITYLALARVGAVSVPVNPRLRLNEIQFVVEDCGAGAIITDADFAAEADQLLELCAAVQTVFTLNDRTGAHERLEDLVGEAARPLAGTIDPDALALIIYTSGTTGVPKGVARTHDANLWTIVNSQIGQPRYPEDVEVFVLPLFGIAFIFQVMPMLFAGGRIILDGAFDAQRTWERLASERATRVFLAPTMLDSMLSLAGQEGHDVSSLRILNTAYEFPERVRTAAVARFGDIIAYMYGLTEAQLCVSTPEQFKADPTDAGLAMGMMRVRVVDDDANPVAPGTIGEITLEGPSTMASYYGREEATAESLRDGWLYTGDLGYLDDGGRVHISGRKKSMIKTGGFSVDPVEIENVMLDFPGVREAGVVGVPDEHWGEQVVAFVATTAGAEVAEPELLAHVKAQLAGFKCPKQLWFLDELPKTGTGKIERGRLKALAVQGAPSGAGASHA
jgi:acyl-CoA synthetase (AMP-forming)/AMP-acid ligase II